MPFPTKQFSSLLRRSFSSAAVASVSAPTLRCTNKIHRQYKLFVLQESQKALTEYLHATQGLPFFFADLIAKNSLFSLSKLTRNLRFSVPAFPATISKALRYQVINEFEFFFESIGIEHRDIPKYLPRDRFFLSDDNGSVLEASVALFQFGFPWNTLGKLYADKVSIFRMPGRELMARLCGIRDYCCFHNLLIAGVCLAFPELLVGEERELSGNFAALFEDLKRVFKGFDHGGCVDDWYEVCCKIRFIYELGCERGTMLEKRILFEFPKQVLEHKADYFCKFGVRKDKVGYLLLRNPDLLGLDLETPAISVSGLLKHFGFDAKELQCLSKKYPHVFGRNKMGNLPGIARALDLHEWFFDKIERLGFQIFATYAIDDDHSDYNKFRDDLKKLESKRSRSNIRTKLDFLTGLGFGENASTLYVLCGLHAISSGLQERFEYLLSLGIKYSEICSMMKIAPCIFCVNSELVDKKVEYLCTEMGSSIKYLDSFPRFLLFDLENRIKPRHRIFAWLRQTGLCTKNYSIKSIIDTSEKRFIARILNIHRAAPKLYLECYLRKS